MGGRRRPTRPAFGVRPSPVLWASAAAVGLAVALPAAYLIVVVADSPSESFEAIWEVRTLRLLGRSALLAATVTAAAVAIAVPLAWLTVRTDLPARRAWTVLAMLPLVVPSYIVAYTFISAFGPKGLAFDILRSAGFGIERLPDIYGFFGAFAVLTLSQYPFVLLTVRGSMRRLDPRLEDAAMSLGASPAGAFRKVVLPQLVPAIGAGSLLVSLYVLSDFGAVSLMRFDSFTRVIYTSYVAGFDRIAAAALSLVLAALALAILWGEARSRRGLVVHSLGPGTVRPPEPRRLGRWRWPALAFCCAVVVASLGIPVAVLIYWLTKSFAGTVVWSDMARAAWHSVAASGLAAVAAAICAIPVSVLVVRHRSRLSALIDRLSYAGHALPGIVVALALVFFGIRLAEPLYQTLPMLVFAYVILFLPQALGSTKASLHQIPPTVEEAGRSLGRGQLGVLARVTAPLAAPGVVAGAALVFLTAIKELPATLILAPIGFDTLALEIWRSSSVGFFEIAAAPSLVLLAVSAVPLYLLAYRER